MNNYSNIPLKLTKGQHIELIFSYLWKETELHNIEKKLQLDVIVSKTSYKDDNPISLETFGGNLVEKVVRMGFLQLCHKHISFSKVQLKSIEASPDSRKNVLF